MTNEKLRAACYILLAKGLVYPHETYTDELALLLDSLTANEKTNGLSGALNALRSSVREADALDLEVLQGEHTGLFINRHPRVPCPPYESAYRENRLMGAATDAVAHTFGEWGLEIVGEPADYAGAELEFMAFVIRMSSQDGATETIPAQRTFLRDHVMTWMPRFAADMQVAAGLPLYRSLGGLMEAFLSEEEATMLADGSAKSTRHATVRAPAT